MNKISLFLSLIFVGLIVLGCNSIEGQQQQKKNLHADDEEHIQDLPAEDISESEIEALSLAINDEYKARATYQRVINKFGDVKPFSNIINSESNHIAELINIYNKYALTIPEDDWLDKVPVFSSVEEACQAGVDAEVENAALYEELFSMVDNQDIIAVFNSLKSASENNHLPAFERCSAR